MPDLLLELRSEEIPARMQRKAAGDLKKLVTNALVEAGLTYEAAREYWTPRRLTLDIRGLTPRSADLKEEIKGPSTKAPEQAVQGFLRKAGLDNIAQAHVHTDPKKGDFYVAHMSKPGRAAEEIIADVMPAIIRGFPWPKSMRWGKASAKPGALRWVRPLQSIICTFGPETEEPVVIAFEIDGIVASNITYGHRFHAPDAIQVRRFDDYVSKLERAFVVLDGDRRKQIIAADAQNLAFAAGLELVEDEGLLEEVSGLVEWPVTLTGEFEEAYLQIPDEVIRLTIKTNQKCFVLRKPDAGLSNKFVLVANIAASDGGVEIAHGNAKVVRARLSDALYFWNTDQKDLPDVGQLSASAEKFGLDLNKPLDQRMARLDHLGVTFHAKLGTQGERVQRIAKLAAELAPIVGADPALATRAAVLAKADLTTEIVGEFPELQGAMGRTYAALQGEHASVALALEEHYKPQGPSDSVPTDPVAIAVALADKLDTLVGFWAIDEKPTGSKDPYALRRAALGVIRIVVENSVELGFHDVFNRLLSGQIHDWWNISNTVLAISPLMEADRGEWDDDELNIWGYEGKSRFKFVEIKQISALDDLKETEFKVDRIVAITGDLKGALDGTFLDNQIAEELKIIKWEWKGNPLHIPNDLLSFFHDRLKVYLKDQGARHDLIDAVITPEADDLLQIVRRVEALGAFLDTEDGRNLLAGAKRAANILAAEEKKGTHIAAVVSEALFEGEAEKTLFMYVNQVAKAAAQAVEKQDYSAAMAELATLREPVDSFFEDVLVNSDDAAVRANRLALVGLIRTATATVADFSRISG